MNTKYQCLKGNSIAFPGLLLATVLFVGDVVAQAETDIAPRMNEANELVRTGKVIEAIEAYSQIPTTGGRNEELEYNLGIAHYRNGDLDAASTLFTRVAGSSDNQLAANSQYNLGNCCYSRALQVRQQDVKTAIANLRQAISLYRSSLRSDPDNADARANIELAVRLLQELEQEQDDQQSRDPQQQNQQNEDQNQQQDQPNEDQQNEDQQNQDQQDQDPQNQEQQNQDQQQDSSDRSETGDEDSSDNDSREPSDEESQPEDSGSGESEQPPSSPEDPNSSPENTSGDQTTGEQKSEESDSQPGTDEPPSDQNRDATGELTAAGEQHPEKASGESTAQGRPPDREGFMTYEEALKMLQSVRDRDMLRRLRQQQRERTRRIPVEKDW